MSQVVFLLSFPCFSLPLSSPSQPCGWTSSTPIRRRSGLCRAMDGAQDDKMLSCTREQFLSELRSEEARGEPSPGRGSS